MGTANVLRAVSLGAAAQYGTRTIVGARLAAPGLLAYEGIQTGRSAAAAYQAYQEGDTGRFLLNSVFTVLGGMGTVSFARVAGAAFKSQGGFRATFGSFLAEEAESVPLGRSGLTRQGSINPSFKTTAANPVDYQIDEVTGRTIRAEGIITGSHPGRAKGYRPEPLGGRLPGEHRGHLLPEQGVADPSLVNVRSNIISEASSSNLSAKKVFVEHPAINLADANKNSTIRLIAEPIYRGNDLRPFAVIYWTYQDDMLVDAISLLNK